MADTDLLPSRGVTFEALVDSTGIAINGSSTVAQLASRGMRAACAVDGTGTAITGGGSLAQLAAAGIRAFCAVDENGVAQDSSTALQLRTRGIRPRVLLDANGIALNGSSNQALLASRGLPSFCPVDESGNATTMGAVILLSNSTVMDNATVGSTVGVLSVAGGSGTYTFALTSNPGSLFAISGANLNTAAAMTAGTYPITVQASGGVPTPVTRALAITVIPHTFAPSNSAPPLISGTPAVGQVLTTSNGTWAGFPAPTFTYQWNRVAAVSYATWDPATVTAVTLSGGNLAATNTGTTSTNQGAHVAAASGKTSGKYYFEVTLTTFTNGAGVGVGIASTTATYAGLSGSYTGGSLCLAVGHTGNGVITNYAGNTPFSLGILASGDTICVAVDLNGTLPRAWYRKGASGLWNGDSSGDPTQVTSGGQAAAIAGVSGGAFIPFVTFGSGLAGAAGQSGNVFTANFGASSFVGTPPAGYPSGWTA